ncbi:MAG: phenyltransferase domain-containing protein [Proteobacteria bacterium]|nr:phenyltransferase domain-containing protein [Pseudomonadota bacterium]MBU4470711.1 phenyltransferase domain-containing protein [Pseudomonadota bacterium]MCG2751193.1 phenyltransferase domain-containing protein [Desulfobacteraceae bacterium]
MNLSPSVKKQSLVISIDAVAGLIVQIQKDNGEIPWSEGDKTDPWDHVESAMGLTIAGYYRAAQKAYYWMRDHQLEDGSWYASYRNGEPDDKTHDTNMSTYIAVGLLHHYLVTGNKTFLAEMWDTMAAAIEFAVDLQTPEGEIYWAKSPDGIVDPTALLTGSSSVYMSLKCALAVAGILGIKRPLWREAFSKLGEAIRLKPHLFNMTKSRFSMDWFYPVLCGAVSGPAALQRIDKYWKKFIVQNHGVLCVSDQPWVTIAETSELCLALSAMGNDNLAGLVFDWIQERTYEDGTFWCGYTHPDGVIWPEDKMSWTNAVALMAADALYGLTPAGKLFDHQFWKKSAFSEYILP